MSWRFIESNYWGFSHLEDGEGNDILIPDGENDGDFPSCWLGEDMPNHVRRLIEVSPDLLALCQRVERELRVIMGDLRMSGECGIASELEVLQTDIHDVVSQIPEVTNE